MSPIAPWTVSVVVSALWGIGCSQLLFEGWLAAADAFIAILALARGRLPAGRAVGPVSGALVVGLICSVLLQGGFWFLVEEMGFGRSWQEQAVFCGSLALAARFMLVRVPSRLRESWNGLMNPEPEPPGVGPSGSD